MDLGKSYDIAIRAGAAFERLKMEHEAKLRWIKLSGRLVPFALLWAWAGLYFFLCWHPAHFVPRGSCLTDGQIQNFVVKGTTEMDPEPNEEEGHD